MQKTQDAILMGNLPDQFDGQYITFSVTEECNLQCKYCYMTGKNTYKKMSLDTAKKAVDFFLESPLYNEKDGVVWDFIGGEPLLEIEMIDTLCEYIKLRMYETDHRWFDNYMFNFSTNGLLYGDEKVQSFIRKNQKHASIGITIDGTKEKHDMQRVDSKGNGSYDRVMENIPLWLERNNVAATKVTFAHEDLPLLKESIIHLWEMGIVYVSANVVFEDVWEPGDPEIFEEQLKALADYIVDNELWDKYSVRFFSLNTGNPQSKKEYEESNTCGIGKMVAVDTEGALYPCVRFTDFTLPEDRRERSIGNIFDGVDENKLRPFEKLTLKNISPEKCGTCSVASGCANCAGSNLTESTCASVFDRNVSICEMHKANVRANNYFWELLAKKTGINYLLQKNLDRLNGSGETSEKFLQIITSNTITPTCSYNVCDASSEVTAPHILKKAFEFSENNDYTPILVGALTSEQKEAVKGKPACSMGGVNDGAEYSNLIDTYYNRITENPEASICSLVITSENIEGLSENIESVLREGKRVNLFKQDLLEWNDGEIQLYKKELNKLAELLEELILDGVNAEVNVLTDFLYDKKASHCDAGESTVTVGPNGLLYPCPAFYFEYPEFSIGSLENGVDDALAMLFPVDKAPYCVECNSVKCERCKFLNYKATKEVCIPSVVQCNIAELEHSYANNLKNKLPKEVFKNV